MAVRYPLKILNKLWCFENCSHTVYLKIFKYNDRLYISVHINVQ